MPSSHRLIGAQPCQDPQASFPGLCWDLHNACSATWELSLSDLRVCLLCLDHKSPPPGHFSSGIYWPKTTCVKKMFEILPANHYRIFKKTPYPLVNEIPQVVDFATEAKYLPCLLFFGLVLFCFVLIEQADFSYVSLYLHPSSSRENREEELSKDISLGA